MCLLRRWWCRHHQLTYPEEICTMYDKEMDLGQVLTALAETFQQKTKKIKSYLVCHCTIIIYAHVAPNLYAYHFSRSASESVIYLVCSFIYYLLIVHLDHKLRWMICPEIHWPNEPVEVALDLTFNLFLKQAIIWIIAFWRPGIKSELHLWCLCLMFSLYYIS